MSNYPAAPGTPSASGAAWAPNGCGSGILSEFYASGGLYIFGSLPGTADFSGDPETPVKGNPSIDFGAFCNAHDYCYAAGLLSRAQRDSNFEDDMSVFCETSSAPADCQDYAGKYSIAVSYAGGTAYDDVQAAKKCSAWGNAMKANGCAQ